MTPSRNVPRRAPAPVLLAAGAGLLAVASAGCGSHHAAAAPTTDPAVAALQQRAALAARISFTGTYAVTDSADTAAVVRVWVTPTAYRVEVSEGQVTAALYGTATGTVACPEQVGKPPVCYTVAGAGKPVPSAFDAGIERVFTRDLPALAAGAAGFQVTSVPTPTAVTTAGVACFRVTRSAGAPPVTDTLVQLVDTGTYCLAPDGTPAQLGFASGTLTLSKQGAAPPPVAFRLPAAARALPPSVASATASASPTASVPGLFGTSPSSGS